MRMLESYEKKPYCRAHRPDAKATATTVKGDFKVNQATTVPKAARRQPGVDVTARQTFYVGGGNQSLDTLGQQMHQNKTAINPHGFTPERPAIPNRSRAQGVNKLEGTTFSDTSYTNKASSAPVASESDWSHSAPASYDSGGGYEQPAEDQGGYDQGGYEQPAEDTGGYEQPAEDTGGYDQGGYEQPAEDTGGYDQGGGEYQEGGYDQGGGEYQEGGYDQGGGEYQEGGYDQGGGEYQEGGYEEGGY